MGDADSSGCHDRAAYGQCGCLQYA